MRGRVDVERGVDRTEPDADTALPTAISQSPGVAASTASAMLTRAAPMARGGPGDIVRRIRPVAALDKAEAAAPAASTTPRAPTGSWMLTRIDGHSSPRVDPGSATPR